MDYDAKEHYKGYEIITRVDEDMENPRQMGDSFFKFIGGNKRFLCPEDHSYRMTGNIWVDAANFFGNKFEPEQSKAAHAWVEKNLFYFNIYFYSHGYTTFHFRKMDPWDSGFFGVLAVKYETLFKKFNVDKLDDNLKEGLKNTARFELSMYEAYINDMYNEIIVMRGDECVGALGGVYCDDTDDKIELFKKNIDRNIELREQASVDKLKELIAKKIPVEKIPAMLREVYNKEPRDLF